MLTEEQKLKIKEEEEYRARVREEQKPKKGHGCLIAFLLIFVVFPIIISMTLGLSKKITPRASPAPTIKPGSGINMTRTAIIKAYGAEGFVFTKGEPVNSEENYVAQKDGLLVQLIGPENNLSEADAIAFFDPSSVGNTVVTLSKLTILAGQGGKDCVQWLAKMVETGDVNNPWKKTENVCGRSLVLIYNPGYSESLGIKPAN